MKAVVSEFVKNVQEQGLVEVGDVRILNSTKLKFDISYGKRHDIMMHFVEMMSKGLLECTEKRLTEYLSETTNLGSVEAVRSLYYRCQSEYVRK